MKRKMTSGLILLIVISSGILCGIAYMAIFDGFVSLNATTGITAVNKEHPWSERQEAVFDELKTTSDKEIVSLFDELRVTALDMDKKVLYWANINLSKLHREKLPHYCRVTYEALEFPRNGLRVADYYGQVYKAETKGLEPVAHIYDTRGNPLYDVLLRCFNGYGELKEPTRRVSIIKPRYKVKESQSKFVVIDQYFYPWEIIPNINLWIDFAKANNIPLIYREDREFNVWCPLSYEDAKDAAKIKDYRIALKFPAETLVEIRVKKSSGMLMIFTLPNGEDLLIGS